MLLDKKKVVMGFGHRVYRSGDSRVPTMKKYFLKVAELKKIQNILKCMRYLKKLCLKEKIFTQM